MNAENTVSKNELQNNVPAGDQLERLSPVRLFPQGGKRRVLFIGNFHHLARTPAADRLVG